MLRRSCKRPVPRRPSPSPGRSWVADTPMRLHRAAMVQMATTASSISPRASTYGHRRRLRLRWGDEPNDPLNEPVDVELRSGSMLSLLLDHDRILAGLSVVPYVD